MRFLAILMLLASIVVVVRAAEPPANPPRLDVNGDPLPEGAVARLGSLRFQPPGSDENRIHRGNLRFRWPDSGSGTGMALSPDGTTVAMSSQDEKRRRVSFMDTSTGKVLRQFDLT